MGARTGAIGSRRGRWGALAIVLSALFLDLMDATIVNLVLPELQRSTGAGATAVQWVVAAYTLAFAVVLLAGARLGDVVGRRRVFLIGMAGFTLASAWCGTAPTAEVLVAGRVLQGASAALMVPQVMAIIVVLFDGAERVRALALYGVTLSVANVSGPLVGAALTEADVLGLGWRAVFWLNVPLGLFALVLAARFVPESREATAPRVDVAGVFLGGAVTVAVMFPLVRLPDQGWDAWTLAWGLAAGPLCVAFVLQQRHRGRTTESALVSPELFTRRAFSVGVVMMLTLFSGLSSLFLVLTYALQVGLGWSPLQTAAAVVTWPLGIMVAAPAAGRLAAGCPRRVIGAGLVVMISGVGALVIVFSGPVSTMPFWAVAAPTFLTGVGMGLCTPTLTGLVLAGVDPAAAGAASGVVNAVMQLGTALGIALIGSLFFWLVATDPDPDRGAVYTAAASAALWGNVAVLALTLCLVPLLRAGRGDRTRVGVPATQ